MVLEEPLCIPAETVLNGLCFDPRPITRCLMIARSESELQFVSRLTSEHIEQLWRMYQGEWWSRGRKLED